MRISRPTPTEKLVSVPIMRQMFLPVTHVTGRADLSDPGMTKSARQRQTILWTGGRSGFSLLETILAIAIFVGAVAILSRLLILGLENAELTDWQSRAWLVAENAWAELESGVQQFSQSGPFPVDEMPGWQWSVAAEPTDITDLYRITIRVEKVDAGAGQGTAVELSRLFFDDVAQSSEQTQ